MPPPLYDTAVFFSLEAADASACESTSVASRMMPAPFSARARIACRHKIAGRVRVHKSFWLGKQLCT